jgi:hypothetical protein
MAPGGSAGSSRHRRSPAVVRDWTVPSGLPAKQPSESIERMGKWTVVLKRLAEIVCVEHPTARRAAREMVGLDFGLTIDGVADFLAAPNYVQRGACSRLPALLGLLFVLGHAFADCQHGLGRCAVGRCCNRPDSLVIFCQ